MKKYIKKDYMKKSQMNKEKYKICCNNSSKWNEFAARTCNILYTYIY